MPATQPDASMDQVRELLFGSQLKQIEDRLKQQEEHIMSQIEALRAEMRQSLSSLESGIEKRLVDGRRELSQVKAENESKISSLKSELEERATELGVSLDKAESGLRKLFMDENGRISAALEERYKYALDALSINTAQIRQEMVDRNTISGLLSDLARKIGPEPVQEAPEPGKQQ